MEFYMFLPNVAVKIRLGYNSSTSIALNIRKLREHGSQYPRNCHVISFHHAVTTFKTMTKTNKFTCFRSCFEEPKTYVYSIEYCI